MMSEFLGSADSKFPDPDNTNFDWFKPPEEPCIPAYAFSPGIEPPMITSATTSRSPDMGGLPSCESFFGSLDELLAEENIEALSTPPQSTALEQLVNKDTPSVPQIIVREGNPEALGILESPHFPGLEYWRAAS